MKAHTVFGWWDQEMPAPFQRNVEAWRARGVELRVWTPDRVKALLDGRAGEIPSLARVAERYPEMAPIQQCDLARYAIVALEGGYYADCDLSPLHIAGAPRLGEEARGLVLFEENTIGESLCRNIEAFVTRAFHVPHVEHALRVANFVFGAESHARSKESFEFWSAVFSDIAERYARIGRAGNYTRPREREYATYLTTGPDVMTCAWARSAGQPGVQLEMRQAWEDRWFSHAYHGSWKNTPTAA